MKQLTGWVENNTEKVKPLGIFDFAARLIDHAIKANYNNTKDIHARYINFSSSLNALEAVKFNSNNEDELKMASKAVYTCYNELVNEIQNFLNCHNDDETRFHLRELICIYGHYRRYA